MKYVVGNRNTVYPDVTGLVALNCNDQEFDSEYNDHTIFNNGALIVDANGLTGGAIKRRRATLTGAGNTISSYDRITLFFLDASAGNVAVTLEHGEVDRVFIRVDGTENTAIITPDSGLINGAASYNVATQYEKITVLSNETNFYF